ncbi:hypothetical protein HJC23_001607 [Cyclotella cryptica]|uniref:tRNA(Ile)-lysidine synthetase n=1 Tax=Cyclotella cryptica TaxID=29204 RepID=A0ABD3NZL6_9STRA
MTRVSSRTSALLLLTAFISSVFSSAKNLSMMRKCTNDLFRKNAAHFNTHRCKQQTTVLVRRYYSAHGHRKRLGKCSASTPITAFATETPKSIVGPYKQGQQQYRLFENACIARKSAAVNDDCVGHQKEESLKVNLVKPHLEYASTSNSLAYSTNEDIPSDPPTLVLVLAVSGGCDSVALFHAVMAMTRLDDIDEDNIFHSTDVSQQDSTVIQRHGMAQWYLYLDSADTATSKRDMVRIPCEIHVAHFNHEQRGENSDGDEALVRSLCSCRRVPFHRYSWSEMSNDDSSDSTNSSTFSQDVARKWRRTRLMELLSSLVTDPYNNSAGDSSQRWGAILTAHHRDDAEETILLKLLRGSYLTNLSGMEDRSDGFQLNTPKKSQLGYFAKPLLGIRKAEIVDYLTAQGLEWREDESNSQDKYKRNKVRNQLIPLLSELAGGEDALQKRLRHLEQQSRDLSHYLAPRAEEYLASMSTVSMFLLPDDSHTLTIVQQEALHLWIARATEQQLILSYEQMQRIRNQIEFFPTRLQWILDVGDCWNVRRNGKALAVSRAVDGNGKEQSSLEACLIPWKILPSESETGTNNDQSEIACVHTLHFGKLPHEPNISNLVIKRAKDVSNMVFIPPWRKGRSAVKIREFLRGQKVPLHRRDDSFVLCYSDDSLIHALAVYLENIGRWVVHSDFSHEEGALIKIVLGKKIE